MKKNKIKIIFTRSDGRFANQLINYANLAAYKYENTDKIDFINFSFWPYRFSLNEALIGRYCSSLANQKPSFWFQPYDFLCTTCSNQKALKYLSFGWGIFLSGISKILPNTISVIVGHERLTKFFSGDRVDKLNLDDNKVFEALQVYNIWILSGWGIRAWKCVEKHQDKVRKLLSLNQKILDTSEKFIKDIRQEYDYIVGFHMRQGDYISYRDGKYYFDSQQYLSWIREVTSYFSDKGKVGIIATSDTFQDEDFFSDKNIHFSNGTAGRGHYVLSMAELSMCDLIVGPPSTFSLWSAFMGNCPILTLKSSTQQICDADILENHLFDALRYPEIYRF